MTVKPIGESILNVSEFRINGLTKVSAFHTHKPGLGTKVRQVSDQLIDDDNA